MPGEITVAEEDSGCSDHLTPEVTAATSPRSSGAKSAGNAALIPKCISDKKFTVATVVLVTSLIIIIISLAASLSDSTILGHASATFLPQIFRSVKKTQTFPTCPPPVSVACPDSWIGYRRKCFYVSKEERDWHASLNRCSSFNASLAVIDTENELDFWVDFLGTSHYWFGLSKVNQVWKWPNGTEFKKQFPVRGEGSCAYINEKGASSTRCTTEKHFLCSQPENCTMGG